MNEPIPQTPLQQALLGPQGPALHAAHAARLAQLARHCRQRLDAGLAPAEYGRMQQLLAMCQAAAGVLGGLAPPTPAHAHALGPAAGLPRAPAA